MKSERGRSTYFTVDWKMISKRVMIEQDGAVVANEGHWHSPFSKKFWFDVGSSERHHVDITAGPFQPIELKVDSNRVVPLL
jgi:hypothetical protein